MKKIITSIVAILLLLLTMTSCNEEVNVNELGLIEDGMLYVATSPDYPPFEYLEGNNIVGFDIDLLNELAKMSGLEVEYTPLAFDVILTSVQSGQFDVGMSAFSAAPNREVLFSNPYYNSSQVTLLPLDSDIKVLDDLYGKRIGAGLGTTGETAANKVTDKVTILETNVALPMLLSGQLDAYICDIGVAENAVATGNYTLIETPISKEEVSIVFKLENTALCNEFNNNLAEFMKTEKYNELLAKYGLN